jgi:hypothetical protein
MILRTLTFGATVTVHELGGDLQMPKAYVLRVRPGRLARHIIQRTLNLRLLRQVAPCDVASIIRQALAVGHG